MPCGEREECNVSIFARVDTRRLALRMPEWEDAGALYAILHDPAVHAYNPAGPMKDPKEAADMLAEWLADWWADGYGYWVVRDLGLRIVGMGGVRRLHFGDRDILNLYYRFSPATWGRGYASEMAATAVEMARLHLPHLPAVAAIRPANRPSQRVAEKAGLGRRPDLDTEDHQIWALGWSD